jgi:hypothetical protein
MGEGISLQGKELEGFYNHYFDKIEKLLCLLESMGRNYKDMDITHCSDKALKQFRCSDNMLNLAMEGIESKQKEMEEILGGLDGEG